MALSAAQLKAREGMITASFLPVLMSGDKSKILNRWQEIVGDPEFIAEDLSSIWAVEFGSFIEPFALDWHQKKTGLPLIRRGEVVIHPTKPYFCCTLDAYREPDRCVLDCKAPGTWRKIEEVISYYTPQMIGQAACLKTSKAALLVVHGGSEPQEHPIEWTPEYEAQVWQCVEEFQHCCETLTPPVQMEPIAPPVPPIKEYDFSSSNEFCNEAAIWLENREASKKFDGAAKNIKSLIPPDGIRAFGGGVTVNRSKSGSLTIKEAKS